MKRYNIGVEGISGMVTQIDTALALTNWFEFNEEREYVLKFHEYCLYMLQYGRNGHESAPYSRMYKMLQMLEKGELKAERKDFNDLLTDTYCTMMYDVGVMLVKCGALLNGNDVGWKRFNIVISLPKKLVEYIGEEVFTESADSDKFYKVLTTEGFNNLVDNRCLLDMLQYREDFCLQDILKTEDTEYEDIVKAGITYMLLSKRRIKCRIGDE